MPNPNQIAGTEQTILGTAAVDTITFTAEHTTVKAGEGANTITGTSGHNLITAGGGVDTITVTSGNNTIQAGGGANTITATLGNNTITSGDGVDTITVTSGNNTINAGGGANTILATSGINIVTTGDGVDTITLGGVAGGGNTINAGGGANTIITGAGNDTVTTGNGIDTITTGAGDDVITIKGGIDTINAGAGTDTLIADFSAATGGVTTGHLVGNLPGGYTGNISGFGVASFVGVENFDITSGSFNDVITTGDGTDIVRSGAGDDIVALGGGDDEAIYSMAANAVATDVYQAGNGVDKLTLEFTTEEWLSDEVQADIASYLAVLNGQQGEANSAVFQFTAFDLSVSEFEFLSVVVDGVVQDLAEPTIVNMLALDGDQTFQATASADYFVYNMDATSNLWNVNDVDTFTIEDFDPTQDKLIFINAEAISPYQWLSERGHIETDTYYYDRNGHRSRYDHYEQISTDGSSIDVMDRTRVNYNNSLSLDHIDLLAETGSSIVIDAFAYPDNTTPPEDVTSSILIYMDDPFVIV